MFNYKLSSEFKNNVNASVKKNSLANLADYALVFILTMLVFTSAGLPIFSRVGPVREQINIINNHDTKLKKIIGSTYLQDYNEEKNTLSSISEDASKYVEALTKTYYYLNNLGYPVRQNDGTYLDLPVKIEDTLANKNVQGFYSSFNKLEIYFSYFKETDPSINFYTYDGIDYRNKKSEYVYANLYKYDPNKFEEKVATANKFEQLKEAQAILLKDYFVYGNTSSVNIDALNYYKNAYSQGLQILINEVENYYLPYINEVKVYESSFSLYATYFMICLFISYFVCFSILEIIPRFFLKGRTTIGFRMMRAVEVGENENQPIFLNYLLKYIARLFTFFSGTFFMFLFIGNIGVLFLKVSWFSFYMVYLLGAALTLGSLVLILSGKPSRSLEERIARTYTKDFDILEKGESLGDKEYGEIQSGR
ncbi:MAG: hypothetical protein SPL02_00985 [Bacilli bacterium]|nr:hypothetical protein [Bacilli bacterium]